MEFKAFFVLVLIFFLIFPTQAVVINPSVESQSWLCRYSLTKWICDYGGKGGTINLPDIVNISENNTFVFNSSYISSQFFNNSNITLLYSNLSNTTFYGNVTVVSYSEMNQTPNLTAGPPGAPGAANMTAGPQGIQGIQGIPGAANMTMNLTANMTMNLTANMTAGPQGIQGIQGIPGAANMTMNLTINLTANMTMNQTMLDESVYAWRNNSRAWTGGQFYRNTNDEYIGFTAGSSDYIGGGSIFAYGKNYSDSSQAGGIYIVTINAAKNSFIGFLKVAGNTDTPYMNMLGHNITNVGLRSSAQSSAVCFNSTTKEITYNSGVTTCTASTEAVKKNKEYLAGTVSARLMQLKPAAYSLDIDGEKHYGLIAEDVVKVFPELAAHDETGTLTGVRYEEFTALLLKGYQEQQTEIEDLKKRIESLEKPK